MTYGELDAAAHRLARYLRGRGVLPGARVGVFLERGPELIATLLAILRTGAAYVPLDPAYPAERLAWLAADAGLAATVTSSGLRDALPDTHVPVVDLDAERDAIRAEADTDLGVPVTPDAAAYVIYTSGSTGRPKGVVVPHRGIVRLVRGGGFAEMGPGTVFLQLAPAAFDAATLEIWGPLLNGGRVALAPAGTPEVQAIAAAVRGEGVTHLWLTAGLFHLVADEDPAALTGVRHLLAGGDVLSADHLRRVMDAVPAMRITNGYGPTENTTFTACHDIAADDLARASVPVGRPIADTVVHVLDDRLRPCPAGVPGELYTGGAGLAWGYLNRPGLTASSFVPDPYGGRGSRLYRTGDLVRWREEGVLEFLGRIDQQVKVRGFRVEPGEIEAALRDHADVGDAVVVARADGPGEKRLVAYVTARNGVAPEPAALRDALSRRLPGHMVPSAWVLLDALPLTPNGKVDRRALPAPGLPAESDDAFAAPRTPTEDVLAAIWAELLRLPRVGTDDDFFLLGGHSLVATRVLSRVRQAFGAEVPLRTLFESSRLASFAERVDEAVRQESGIAAPPLTPAAGTDLPLSFAQERLWFIDRLEPGNPVYNMPFPVRMRGALDESALARAMAALVDRHAVLRTRFAVVDGAPVQRVGPGSGFSLETDDQLSVAESDRDAVAAERSGAWAATPFDLEQGPLFRARLVRFAADDHLLLLAMHHAVSDGWSMGVFWRELIALYRGFADGQPAELAPLPVQYADFAAWQREWLSGPVLERQVAWWREHLAGAPARLELPVDHPRPPVQSHRGAVLPFHLPPALVEPVRALARTEGATLFMALLAAWQLLLSRWSGQEDVVVGTPVAGRTRREVEGLIGFFVNTLAIRGDLSGEPSFRAHLARVREATLGAYAHQDLPFERLVEELQPGRSLSHAPIYQVMMVLQNTPDGPGEGFPGITLAGAPGGSTVAKVDLTLGLVETTDGGLRGAIEYATDLFDAATVERMAGHFANLLAAAASNADTPVADLSLMSAAERAATEAMGAVIASFPVTGTLHGTFGARAARFPEATAVTFGDQAVSYGDLDARANRLAHHLRALGAGPDTLVGLCVERSVETVTGILAILKAGAAYLPLDPAYPEDRLAYMLDDSGVRLVLATDSLADRLPSSATVVRMDADAAAIGRHPSTVPAEAAGPESLAYVIYTSGSTGRPKGVQVTHANVIRLFSATNEWFGFGAEDVWTLFHSYAFDFSVWELWGALLHGGRLVVVPFLVSREPDAFYALLEAEGVTVLNQTPSAFRQLMRAEELAAAAGNARTLALREVIFGGEALDPASLRGWVERRGAHRPRLVNMYGITETTVHVTWRVIGAADVHGGSASPIGVPIPDLSVQLLDRRGNPVPVGVVGEMYVGGAGVARGYLNRPSLTAERFVAGGGGRLYRSGDLARRRVDGGLEFFGRADDQVKVRGFRIELGEIESVLLEHPAVREAVVLPRGSGDAERLVAWMVMADAVADAALRTHLRGHLPEYMVPGAFVRMDALPLTRNGKVDRRALPEPETPARPGAAEARTPTEELLAAIWAELLGAARVGPEDGFFELGGHSLLATRVVSRVREAFGVELPVRAVFEHATLGAQATEIDRMARAAAGSEAPPIVAVARDGDLPLSFAQERMWFVDRLEPGSPVYHMPFQYLLHGSLNRDALGRALDEVVRRHEPLRTRFPRVDGIPVQRVESARSVPFPTEDLTGLPEAERGPEALRRARAESAAPFDLEQGPLFRASLVRLGEDDHLLLLTLHHVISDGWSMGVLWNELSALYDAYSRNAPSPLAPLRIQYADFAHWQREWLSGSVLDAQLGFWRDRLGGAPPLLALPTDRPRPPVQTHTGAAESMRLDREVADAVLSLGRREGATLFMVLLAALDVVLGRLAGQDDVVVGTPIAGRTRGETEGLIGLFLNSLALRTDLSGNPSFGELLRRVREGTLEAYAHQDVPFEQVLEALRPERSLAHSPVFQVMINLSNFAEGDVSLPGLEVRPIGAGGAPASKFDLTLYAGEAPEGLALHLVYNPDLFDAGRMKGVLAQIGGVLRQAAADPTLPIGTLSLVTEEGRSALPNPALPLPAEPWTGAVHERFAERADAAPDRLAVADAERRWTYGEVEADANRVANRLIAGGVRPGDVVAVLGHRSAGLVRALLGVWKAGAAFVVLDPAYPAARLAAQMRIALPAAFVRIDAAGGVPDELAAALSESVHFELVLHSAGLTDADAPSAPPRIPAGPDDLAYLAFTSGTTGVPKAVAGTHRPLSHFFGWYGREFATGAGDRFALLAGLAHDPLLRDLFAPLTCGGSMMVPDPARIGEPGWLAGWMRSSAVTVAHLTPAMAQLMSGGAGEGELPALRLACFGGDLLSATDVQAVRAMAPGVEVVNFYGATETPQAMGVFRVPAVPVPGIQPVGRGIDGVQLLVLTPGGERAGVGEVGEVVIRTPYLSGGYRGDAQLTEERFILNPWSGDAADRMYRTGDLGRHRADGEVEIAGRADAQVKVRGFRVEPAEIVAALRTLPAVRDAVVLAHGTGTDRALAAWLVADGERPDAAYIREQLRARLPEWLIPSWFVWMDAIPLTPNGKVDRRALPAPDAAAPTGGRAPETDTERTLAEIWSLLLRREDIRREDHFFSLGGHSLLATRVSARVRDAFGVELPLRAVFEHATLASLAAEIDRARAADPALAVPPIRPLPRGDTAPASFAQERMWFVDRMEPGSAVYLMPSAHRLRGAVDAEAMRAAVTEMVRRHETLRTALPEVDGLPMQRILPAGPVALPVHDLSGRAEGERPDALRALAAENANLPFDVEHGPLFRASLVRLAEDEHVLLLNVHHAVSDGWSNRVLIAEITALHDAFRQGRPSPLAPLPVQYADYALWQREWMRGPVLDQQLAWWRDTLAGAPPRLELPADRPRAAVQTHRGASAVATLEPALADSVRELARREGATPFMVLLAGFSLVLSRLAGQEDVVVGTPVAGRTRAEVEGLIGLFLNSLALRTDLSGNPSFTELVRRVREATLGAYAHQDVPFERVLEGVRPERSLSHSPVFQVMLNLLNFGAGDAGTAPEQGATAVTGLGAGAQLASKFDLTLYAAERPDGLALHLVYNADLFDAPRMDALLAQLGSVLRQAATEPARPLNSFLLGAGADVLPDPAEPLSDAWRGSLPFLFTAHAARAPHALAVEDPAERWTYGELDAAASRIAARLVADGVRPGDVIAIWAHRSAALVRALVATLRAGAAFVVLDPAYPAPRLAKYARLARPAALLRMAAAGPVPPLVEELLSVTVRCTITLGVRSGEGTEDVDGLASVAPVPPEVEIGADSLAYLSFTSGSTGTPRAVMGRHGSLTHFTPWLAETFGVGAEDRFSLLSGLSHDPLHRDIFTPLQLGAAIVAPRPERMGEPGYLAAWMAEREITITHLTPAMGQLVTDTGDAPTRISSLRMAFFVGDVLTRAEVARLHRLAPSVQVVNCYGATETQRAVSFFPVPRDLDSLGSEVVPVGRGIRDVQLILRTASGARAGIGELAEIWMRSPHVALGYHGEPALTAERFVANPWTDDPRDVLYRTGDLGRYRADGTVEIAGRADRQVKARGFRVEPGEVEAAIRTHPAIRDTVVVSRGGGDERRLVAYVVGAVDEAALRTHLRARVPEFMVPAEVVRLDALPVTPNGKVDRAALPEPATAAPAGTVARSATEAAVAEIWAEVLGREAGRIASDADFFTVGGHSLRATQVLSRIRSRLGVELAIRDFFAAPTVAAMAAAVDAARPASSAPAVAPKEEAPAAAYPPGVYPLTFPQQRLWVLSQLGSTVPYNMPGVLRLVGPLDDWALERALDEVVRRHEPLRTRIERRGDEPVQVVQPPRPVRLRAEEVSLRDGERVEDVFRRMAEEEALRPFPAEGPYFRVRLVRAAEEEHLLLWTMHHIVSDGWSIGIFRGELATLYRAFAAGDGSPLPPLPLSYGEHAAQQRRVLAGEVMDGQVAWWADRLRGAPGLLELPTDYPRPATPSGEGASVSFEIAGAAGARVGELARATGTTPFMVLLAAFQVLLARWSGQDDVVVGTPIANRTRPEVEGLIGFFANTLALRGDVNGEPSFTELLARVREATLGAYDHQDVPFERVVEAVRPERTLSHNPLFQAMFTLVNTPPARGAGPVPGELAWVPLPRSRETSLVDLSLTLAEQDGRLSGMMEFATDLFRAETVRRMAEHFAVLLNAALADPESPVSSLALATAEEAERLLALGNGGGTLAAETVAGRFAAQARERPGAVALVAEGVSFTYAQLAARVERMAARLRTAGARPDQPVAVVAEHSAAAVVGMMGAMASGGAYLPVDAAHPAERIAYTLADSGAAVVAVQAHLRDRLPPTSLPVLVIEEDSEDAEHGGTGTLALPDLDSAAYVLYTSGSTGAPKAVVVSHAAAVANVDAVSARFGITAEDRVLGFSSLTFDPSVEQILIALLSGGRLVMREPGLWTPAELAARVAEEGITYLDLPTAYWNQLVDDSAALALVRRHVRLACIGGEAMVTERARRWVQAPGTGVLVNGYGPTEMVVTAGLYTVPATFGTGTLPARTPVGTPPAGRTLRVLDARLRLLAEGVPGELYIGGPVGARGYLGRPALTAERFVPDPFGAPGSRMYRSGDLARWMDGELEFLGRADMQVKVRGYRVEPGEVESVLRTHPEVRDVAVAARPDAAGENRLVAYVAGEVDEAALRDLCASRLPVYMVPQAFVPVDALPMTRNGKVDYRALPDPGGGGTSGYLLPTGAAEVEMAALWADTLGVKWVGARDDFFRLGGHSLLAVRLLARVGERFGRDLPLGTLFQNPTLSAFTAAVRDGAEAEDDGRLRVTLSGGTLPPFFCMPPAGGTVTPYTDLARLLGPDQPFHALQAPGVATDEAPLRSVTAMAERFQEEIRRAQPAGPYRLGGWSAGGLVALEVARRLRAEGEEVALLALFDTIPPDALREAVAPDRVEQYVSFARNSVTSDEVRLTELALELRSAGPAGWMQALSAWVARNGAQVMDAQLERLSRVFDVYEATAEAVDAYRLADPYAGPVALFVAEEANPRDAHLPPLAERWKPFVTGSLRTWTVPGAHARMVYEPNVRVLADALREALRNG